MTPRVRRNDWSAVRVPPLGRWRPELTVSVVIPAYDCQEKLDLALAALAHQTYPADLLEVVVVDDGSRPPLELPMIRPARCHLERVAHGWGRANALRTGAARASGDIIHWLDADMVVYPSHVEAQARWHHQLPYAVTLGWKRFVGPPWPARDQVADACAADRADALFADRDGEPHPYVEEVVARTDWLRDADHLAFMVHVGATAALRRELYDAAGGMDPALRLGEDTELGYRLAQAGAVFVPEPQARSWHLGRSHMMRQQAALQRYNRPFLADRMPQPRWLRDTGGTGTVPLVTVVVEVDGEPLERVRETVDPVLRGTERDLAVVLVGPWGSLTDRRVPPLSDPLLDLRLVHASYASDPRVRLVEQPPESGFPSPYLLRLPTGRALAPDAIIRLVEYADRERLGLVRAGDRVELWRTAAVARAGWVRRSGADLTAIVSEVYGVGELPVGRGLAGPVQVAGFRSLARATAVVGRLAWGRASRRVARASHRLTRERRRLTQVRRRGH